MRHQEEEEEEEVHVVHSASKGLCGRICHGVCALLTSGMTDWQCVHCLKLILTSGPAGSAELLMDDVGMPDDKHCFRIQETD